jgi:hypothetical protein
MRDKTGREIAYAIRNLDECQTRLTEVLEVLNNEQLAYLTDLAYAANAKNDCKKVSAKLLKGDPKTMIDALSKYAFLLRLGDEWIKRNEYGGES